MTATTNKEEPITYSLVEGVATITLNRPKRMNAMTYGLMRGLSDAIGWVVDDKNVRVVVLTGAGRGFCSGADLSKMSRMPSSKDSDGTSGRDESYKEKNNSRNNKPNYDNTTFDNTMRALMNCPVPTIARINGPVAGGGFGLALGCDITIAAHSAFFVATFGPDLGIVPDMGATWNITRRVGRARALGITLLGERIGAAQAQEWGLIWRAVADEELDSEVARMAAILKRSSPATCLRIRAAIDSALHNSFSEQLDLETSHQDILIPRNIPEGARAFMEKRKPNFGNRRD